jgi:hypothetical protein
LKLGVIVVLGFFALPASAVAQPLTTEDTVALPDTGERIDHMAIDLARKHLFVSELGNGTLDVVDLAERKVVHRITGLKEPQGVAYESMSDLLAVASGGDGTVRLYAGADFRRAAWARMRTMCGWTNAPATWWWAMAPGRWR